MYAGVFQIQLQPVEGLPAYGHEPLLIALAYDFEKPYICIYLAKLEHDQLRHPQAGAVEYFYDGSIAVPLRAGKVYAREQEVYLGHGKHVGQFATELGAVYELGGVGLEGVFEEEVFEKLLDSGEYARLRVGAQAQIVDVLYKLM